jgi:50S ribosomal protein L16 3-hydroxylase
MLYDDEHLFVNGESRRVARKDAVSLRRLADRRRLGERAVAAATPAAKALLREWLRAGWLRLEPDPAHRTR